jgi:uncharacterized metal-binding protein YceD (DUF177 family)
MLKIDIHGMKDGEYELELCSNISKLECNFEEFIGDVKVKGKIRKIGNRYSIESIAEVTANLICDLSLQNYQEIIISEVNLSFKADTKSFLEKKNEDYDSEILIREDAQFIDLSKIVLEFLALKLPMKRIAPEYKDKEITDIYPFLNEKNSEIDSRWNNLKNFKIN